MEAVERAKAVMDLAEVDEEVGRGLAMRFYRYVKALKEFHQISGQEAIAKAQAKGVKEYEQWTMECPPEEVTWYSLYSLSKEQIEERWQEIKQIARQALRTGETAAEALDGTDGGTPYSRAGFLAVREALVEEWQPRGGMELQLIDTLAQAYEGQNHWLKVMMDRTTMMCEEEQKTTDWGGVSWRPPRVTEWEAIENAMGMFDKWNRIYLRTARALRDLRRYAPSVTIQNAGQVNIGEKQINVKEG